MPTALRVLLVDDEPCMRESMSAALSQLGFIVKVVEGAEAAIKAFDAGWFDVVIVDFRLPGIDGEQFAQVIKGRDSATPVILATGQPPDQMREGVDYVLTKPFDLESLRLALLTVCGKITAH